MRPSGVYDVDYVQDQAIFRTRVDWFWLVAILAALLAIPLLSTEGPFGSSLVSLSLLNVLTTSGILLISITGLNLLLGFTGQISLGQAAFMMVGAYTSAVLTRETDVPFLLALPISAIMAGVIGLVFGLSSLRVKGFYLAMATLAAQFIIPWAINTYEGDWFNLGGGQPLPVPKADIFGFEVTNNLHEYYLVLFFVILTAAAARNLIRSRVGRAWISVRDNDLAAEQLGINVFRYKVLAFFIASVYAGIAGSLDAHVSRSVTPDTFSFEFSIEQLAILVIGGAGFALGPLLGVAFFKLLDRYIVDALNEFLQSWLPDLLTFLNPDYIPVGLPNLLLGLLLALFLIYEPRGLAYRWMIFQTAWRLRPFSKA
jgi:branched-chain amino acid transport system permease protein